MFAMHITPHSNGEPLPSGTPHIEYAKLRYLPMGMYFQEKKAICLLNMDSLTYFTRKVFLERTDVEVVF